MTTVSFTTVGAANWVVPTGVLTVHAVLLGAGGATSGAGAAGKGAQLAVDLATTPGETLVMDVGGSGAGSVGGHGGGANGGAHVGKGGLDGGGGGGRTEIRRGATAIATSGGGGGGAGNGGGGGGGQVGAAGGNGTGTTGGGGGTASAGGAGGSVAGAAGSAGAGGTGGSPSPSNGSGGGGGGGGTFGGGGGGAGVSPAGGGGGSSATTGTSAVFTAAVNAGAGSIVLTFTPVFEPTVVAVSPPNAVSAGLVLKVAATGAAGEVHYWDEMGLFPAALGPSGVLPGFPGLAMPVLSVLIDGANPFAATRGYQDVTQYGHWSIETSQGRMHELTRVEAGKVTLVSDNTQRVFDPDNTAGPLVNFVDVGRRLLIQANWNLLDVNTASLEANLGGWANATNCAQNTTTAQALDGTHSLIMTSSAAGDMAVATFGAIANNLFGVKPNKAYTAIGFPRANTVARACSVGIAWFDASGAQIGATVFGAPVTDIVGGWPAAGVGWDAGGPIDIGTWFIESFDQHWPAGSRASTTITGSDYLKMLNLLTFEAPYGATVIADGATAFLRLQERINPNIINQRLIDWTGNNNTGQGSQVTTITTGVVSPEGSLEPAAVGVTVAPLVSTGDSWVLLNFPPLGAGAWDIEFWANLQTTTTDTILLSDLSNATNGSISAIFRVGAGTAGTIEFHRGANVVTSSSQLINDALWHHYVLQWTGTTILVWIDGVQRGSAAATSTTLPTTGLFFGPQALGKTYRLAEPAIYVGLNLTATQILNHPGGAIGWNNDKLGTRVSHVAAVCGIPTADVLVEAGSTSIQSLTTGGNNALGHCQTVAQTENGLFFADVHGHVVAYGRTHLSTVPASSTSQATFGDRPDLGEFPYHPLPKVARDDLDLWTQVIQQRQGGGTLRARSTAAAAKYVTRTLQPPASLAVTDTDTQNAVNWLLSFYQTPVTRVREITVDHMSDPSRMLPQMLRRALWDRITVNKTPPPAGTGPRFSQAAIIEHIAHRITPGLWETTWAISPAPPPPY